MIQPNAHTFARSFYNKRPNISAVQVNYLFQIGDSNHLLETDLDEVRRMFRDRGRSVICDRENPASANYGNDFHLE